MATAATCSSGVTFNPYSRAFIEDPYPTYRALRERFPVYRYRTFSSEQTMLTRHDDCKRALVDKRLVVDDLPSAMPRHELIEGATGSDVRRLRKELGRWLFFMNAPAHGELRGTVSREFASHAVQNLRPDIEAKVADAFEALRSRGRIDLMSELAKPLPLVAACRMLGVDSGLVRPLVHDLECLFGIFEQPLTLSQYREMLRAADRLRRCLSPELERARNAPREGLLGRLVSGAADMGDDDELFGFVVMLLSVGQETTENYIANGIYALLGNEEQFSRLCDEPRLAGNAALELARYDTPVQFISRISTDRMEIRDQVVPEGSRVYLALGSANRDEERFERADELDITRSDTSNLPFGAGIHFCLGRHLAVLQMTIVLEQLAAFPGVKVVPDTAARRNTRVIRGFAKLELALDRAPRRIGAVRTNVGKTS